MPWVKNVSCGVKTPLPPTANCGDVGVLAGVRRGAICCSRRVLAAVQDIKEAAAGEKDRPARIGAAGANGQPIDGGQLARVVIDLEAADDAVIAGSLQWLCPSHTNSRPYNSGRKT